MTIWPIFPTRTTPAPISLPNSVASTPGTPPDTTG